MYRTIGPRTISSLHKPRVRETPMLGTTVVAPLLRTRVVLRRLDRRLLTRPTDLFFLDLCKAANDGKVATVKQLATKLNNDDFLHHVMSQHRALSVSVATDPTRERQGVPAAITTREEKKRQYDATAGKPTAVCDPYENNGQPLSESQCAELLPRVSDAWALEDGATVLVREIKVDNFFKGAKLLTTVAAVAFNEGHFPVLTLDRRVRRGRRWEELLVVRCKTAVLGGLSHRDFLLAMLIDAELNKATV